ncbi:MAG: hypothetical protein M1319_06375 [Chloroflexi bacterium]|nr:hypothetical protein [Chloroflexota bacterium]
MESRSRYTQGSKAEPWIALSLCAAVLLGGVVKPLVGNLPAYAYSFAPDWLPIAAAVLAGAGVMLLTRRPQMLLGRALSWSGLLLMVWGANGLPLELLRVVGLIPFPVDWPGLVTRIMALAAIVVLVHLSLKHPATVSTRAAAWYGYAAFVFALPYPVVRTVWLLGGMLGLTRPGAGGEGFAAWVFSIPWLMAAALSLLLISTGCWKPRRLLVVAGWTATAIVAMIGPAACWSLISPLLNGQTLAMDGMAIWVPCLFYGSWLLWALAGAAATRSYQLRSAALRMPSPA